MTNIDNKLSGFTVVEDMSSAFNSSRSDMRHNITEVSAKRKHYDGSTDYMNRNISSEYQGIQIRTLTQWINVQLKGTNDSIKSIEKDLRDGKILLRLLSVLSNNNQLKPERGNMRIHQLSNVAQALDYLKDQWGEDNLTAIGNEAIVNGDVKNTLALVFFIMLKYQIQPILHETSDHSISTPINIQSSSLKIPPPIPLPTLSASRSNGNQLSDAKYALLKWVRSQLEDYIGHQIIPNIQDFSKSWRSGLGFCLLIHRYDPYIIPTLFTLYNKDMNDKEKAAILLPLAFTTAEEHMNIPQYLEPNDFIGYPHEPSVMMYISEMYRVISGATHTQTIEQESKRLYDISTAPNSDIIATNNDITPPYSTVDDDVDTHLEEDDSPSTPTPEKITITHSDDVIHEQLDTIASIMNGHNPTHMDMAQLLDQCHQLIHHSNHSQDEKQSILSQYYELRNQWELRSIKNDTPIAELDAIMLELEQIRPKVLHPLDGTPEIAHEYQCSLINASQLINEFQMKNKDRLSMQFHQIVSEFERIEKDAALFNRGVTFAQITAAINDELDVIQQLMMNSESHSVTPDMIDSLKEKINIVSTTLEGVREEYHEDLLIAEDDHDQYYTPFMTHIDTIENRYETVQKWVDKVSICYDDAHRIRIWIKEHIQLVEDRNQADTFDPLSPDVTMDDQTALYLHEEHNKFTREVDSFCSKDMNRLKSYALLSSEDVELTPADTSTIEIAFTTLNMLNYMTHLMNTRSEHIQLLLLRLKWEDLFGNAVQWIANIDSELDSFLREKARWTEKECDMDTLKHDKDNSAIEWIIQTLVSLERRIADFDQGVYSDVLDAYQSMQDIQSDKLPEHLEMRQSGFEKAFEDLMKRSSFSRKVVEQFLSMISVVEKFRDLRERGERLRQIMMNTSSDSEHSDDDEDDSDDYDERVRQFKEDSARMITNISTCVPYPAAPDMSTAMGANDTRDNEVTREAIRVTISTYSTSLALLADALDQLLMSRYQINSLQHRASEAFDSMVRVQAWMNDKVKLLNKTRLDVMLYSPMSTSSSSDTVMSSERNYNSYADEETVLRLEKERDTIASRLNQMEQDDLSKLFETVRILEYDVDASSAVSIDRNALVTGVENLELAQKELNQLLAYRAVELDGLKKRLEWESQWNKANSFLQTIARKLCDFSVKKARYDPSKENVDRPSYDHDSETMQSFQFIQTRVNEFGDRQLSVVLDTYQEIVDCYTLISTLENRTAIPVFASDDGIVPDFISVKQAELNTKHEDLKNLLAYTSDLISQRASIVEFLMRVQDAHHDGEKIKDYISKKLRRIMTKEDDEEAALDSRITRFKSEVKDIWHECGKDMHYPIYNGSWLRLLHTSSSESGAAYRAQVRAQIKSLLDKKMEDLQTFEKSIDQSIEAYRAAENIRSLVMQYENEALSLRHWIDDRLDCLRNQHVDVSAENLSSVLSMKPIDQLKAYRHQLASEVDTFEHTKLRTLHDQVGQLIESIQKKKMQSVNISQAARNLGDVMEKLSQLKCSLADHAISLEAATKREEWENNLGKGIKLLEQMNDQLHQFNVQKNEFASGDLTSEQLMHLEKTLNKLNKQRIRFEDHLFPGIQMSYDAFIEYFPQLSRPIATPDHLDSRMESLGRICARFQENMATKSKELDLLKQRMRWEDTVRDALDYLSRQEIAIDGFIEDKARWKANGDDVVADNDEELLRMEWYALHNAFEEYQQSVIQPLQTHFETLVQESDANVFNNTGNFLSSAFMNKMKHVNSAKERVSYYLSFSNDVVTQRCLVSAFILRTAQLEQSAELIKEEFISSKGLGHIEEHIERLEKFRESIEDVKTNLTVTIPYPMRDVESASDESRMHDETSNTLISETIKTRNGHLDEVYQELQTLLESKERISRRRLSFHYFKKQADITESWIQSRQELLQKSDINVSDLENMDDTDKISKLKEAVGQADIVARSMKGNDTVFNSLVHTYEKCVSAFSDKSLDEYEVHDDDHQELVTEASSSVDTTHHRLSQAWDELHSSATHTLKERTVFLIKMKVHSWLEDLQQLLVKLETYENDIMKHASEDNNQEEQIAQWQIDIDHLEVNGYHTIVADLESKKKLLDVDDLSTFNGQLEQGKDTLQTVKDSLLSIQDQLHLHRLVLIFTDNIHTLQKQIQNELIHLKCLHDQYSVVDTYSAETRTSHLLSLIQESKQTASLMVEIKDHVDEANDQFQIIQKRSPGHSFELNKSAHVALNELVMAEASVSKLVFKNSRWNKCYEALVQIQEEYAALSHTLENDLVPLTTLQQSETELVSIQNTLRTHMQLDEELVKDEVNYDPFMNQAHALVEVMSSTFNTLSSLIKDQEKSSLLSYIEEAITGWCNDCSAHLGLIHHGMNNRVFPNEVDMQTWDDSQIESQVHSLMSISKNRVKETHDKTTNVRSDLDHLRATRIEEAYQKYKIPDDVIHGFITPLNTLLEELHDTMKVDTDYVRILTQLLEYHQDSQVIIQSTQNMMGKLGEYINSIEEFHELNDQMEVLSDNVNDFNAVMIKEEATEECDLFAMRLTQFIKHRVQRVWEGVHHHFIEVKEDFEKTMQYQKIVSKLTDIMQHVDDLTERVNALNLNETLSEGDELDELFADKASLQVKMTEMDSLINTVTEDMQIIALKSQLTEKMDQLEMLLLNKKKEANNEDCLITFYHLMDQFEEQMTLLSSAVDNASPHHSRLVNNKFVKTDLQGLLKSMIAVYKKHQGEINDILKKAQQETTKKSVSHHTRVIEALQKAQKRWTQMQASASGRERELQTCISQLDHEFFTKLAMAKSSPHTRRTKRANQRKVPDAKRASYVADPRNALDMELGNILNACPYRVTMKMIPGQVGKYWFGEDHPRLVYCRILSSQLVMVRVGGGWVELSKFLREHGLTDTTPRYEELSPSENGVFQETYLQTQRAVSPSRRGLSGSIVSTRSSSKSSSRSKSPLPGYVEGDKYVSLDESGNATYVKMKKAEYDAKTPIVKKKSK